MKNGLLHAMTKTRLSWRLVAVSGASKIVLPANDQRVGLQVYLCGAATLHISLDDPAIVGNGWFLTNTLPPLEWCVLTHGDLVTKQLSCITTAAAINLLVCEELLDPN